MVLYKTGWRGFYSPTIITFLGERRCSPFGQISFSGSSEVRLEGEDNLRRRFASLAIFQHTQLNQSELSSCPLALDALEVGWSVSPVMLAVALKYNVQFRFNACCPPLQASHIRWVQFQVHTASIPCFYPARHSQTNIDETKRSSTKVNEATHKVDKGGRHSLSTTFVYLMSSPLCLREVSTQCL